MQVLLVKTSSLGDVIHTLPALTEAAQHIPDIHFDWVVEENFAEVPAWHQQVDKVIPIAFRRWRKHPIQAWKSGEWQRFYQQVREQPYDLIIDAQGLLKSAWVTHLARGTRCGLDWQSAWEPLASLCYQRKYKVDPNQHAIMRIRSLFAAVLNYPLADEMPDGGIDKSRLSSCVDMENYIVFLHGTTWANKHWPEGYWQTLAGYITDAGYCIVLPWGNAEEKQRAETIAAVSSNIQVLPKLNLAGVAGVLAHAKAVIAVDTGLCHLSAALSIPTVSLYGPTDAKLTGAMGLNQICLQSDFPCSPCLERQCSYTQPAEVWPACFGRITPGQVWSVLRDKLL